MDGYEYLLQKIGELYLNIDNYGTSEIYLTHALELNHFLKDHSMDQKLKQLITDNILKHYEELAISANFFSNTGRLNEGVTMAWGALLTSLRAIKYLVKYNLDRSTNVEIIQKYYQGGEILEIGAMPCHLTYCMKKLDLPVVGVDIEPSRADDFLNKHGLIVKKCDIEMEPLPFPNDKFGLVFFDQVFEHLRMNPIAVLKELHRVLAPGGLIILGTPNLCALHTRWELFCGRGYDDPYVEFEKLHWLGHMGHVREYTISQVRKFLCKTGFEIVDAEFRMYNPVRTKKVLYFLQDLCMLMVPRWRPNQIFIARKHSLQTVKD